MNVQYFVGRNPLIERIDGCLQKVDITDDNIKIVVLHGIGGKFLSGQLAITADASPRPGKNPARA